MYFTTDSCDPTNHLLKRLATVQPKWTGLTTFQVVKLDHGYVLLDTKGLFQHCQASLEELDLAGAMTRFRNDLELPSVTRLKLAGCDKTMKLCTMLAPQLEVFNIKHESARNTIPGMYIFLSCKE